MHKSIIYLFAAFTIVLSACQTDPVLQNRYNYKQAVYGMEDAFKKENDLPCEFGKPYKGETFCQESIAKRKPGGPRTIEKVSCVGVAHPTAPKELKGQCFKEIYEQNIGEDSRGNYQSEGNPEVLKWKM